MYRKESFSMLNNNNKIKGRAFKSYTTAYQKTHSSFPINSFSKTVFTQVEILGRFSFLDGPCQNGAKAVPLIDVEQERPTICYVNAPFFFRILIKINGIGEMLWLRRCHSKAIDGHGTPLFIEKHVNAAEIFHGFKASLIFLGL